jgi:Subtilase family
LRAIYYAAQNNANVINMSFDFKTPSQELSNALDYAGRLNIICAASAGNDGAMETVYPAALQTDVMGVASTSDLDTRSTFSNFGNAIVWVAAPGEAIITTYPFGTYSAECHSCPAVRRSCARSGQTATSPSRPPPSPTLNLSAPTWATVAWTC